MEGGRDRKTCRQDTPLDGGLTWPVLCVGGSLAQQVCGTGESGGGIHGRLWGLSDGQKGRKQA